MKVHRGVLRVGCESATIPVQTLSRCVFVYCLRASSFCGFSLAVFGFRSLVAWGECTLYSPRTVMGVAETG